MLPAGADQRQSLRQRYQAALACGELEADAAQHLAIDKLDERARLLRQAASRHPGMRLLQSWFGAGRSTPEMHRGLYFWGGVGRGKTFLMDLFFDSLPFDDKLRLHFHRFMYTVHGELRRLSGEREPLQKVAADMARRARVLCFDEFFVSDITDAMILYRLLDALFERRVMLVATSNVPPSRLYENGLQRAKFVPAIELIERHTEVVNVDGGVDYRLRTLEQADIYYSPLGADAEAALTERFRALAPRQVGDRRHDGPVRQDSAIEVLGRSIAVRALGDGVAWFGFDAICDGPRSQNDYIEIARLYHTVVISGVPVLAAARDDAARRFIALVDEFYDHSVKLLLSAAVSPDALYQGTRLAFEFRRTVSRLLEMQSRDYLAREHRP